MDITAKLLEVARSGGELSTFLYTAATTSTHIDRDRTSIAGDVALTSNALTDVQHFLGERTGPFVATDCAIQDAHSTLKRCQNSFTEIQDLAGQRPAPYGSKTKAIGHGKLLRTF